MVQQTLISAELSADPELSMIARGAMVSPVIVGIVIMAVLPAIFWSVVMAIAGNLAGSPFAVTTVCLTGCSIAVFLAVVCAALFNRPVQTQEHTPAATAPALQRC